MPTFHIVTFGCQANEADSERMAGALLAAGYREAPSAEEADLILLNTCSIREKAEQKVYSLLGRYQALKRERPHVKIGLTGCLGQLTGAALQRRFPSLDLVLGTGQMLKVPALLLERPGLPVSLRPTEPMPTYVGTPPPLRQSRVSAFVNIMEGCNYFCTFCVVPYTRGRERSRPVADVLAEVEDLLREGYQEVTLLGQTVNAYGKTLQPRTTFAALLRQIDALAGGHLRIRFTSPHPREVTPDLYAAMAECRGVCEHLHLPVQSGSDRVLARMRRLYTRTQYLEVVRCLREAVPDVAVSTDLIVGFPGETEEDHRQTLELLQGVQYDSLFAFCYSPRPHTPAGEYPDQLPEPVKRERLAEVFALQAGIALEKNRARIGRVEEVLVERGPSEKEGSLASGRTRQNKWVHFAAECPDVRTKISTDITEAYTYYLKGKHHQGLLSVSPWKDRDSWRKGDGKNAENS
ncbi:MAG TPA: tRNA (N6-isopentenyl adenosine(37)-C2)-methylthiotransferase MiaB [Candidatus Methylomirabilis sp.]|jgi:tRNA-2-methylthio-N6-dimethylallyladenosine synthase|nr:tRNA (N6-isopentenyl adenosine(37)-C2)-methylthiotransferase MiaB [Candidatus Methylomirabilis sp.]